MPTITNIKSQVKRRDRYSIYIDGKYSFSLSELELINSGLKIGQELTKAELKNLTETARLDKAYDRSLNYVALRPRSEWELTDYLKRKGYEAEVIDIILNKLSKLGLVSDLAFARAWVENRRLLKSVSKRRLVMELRQKRVNSEIIEQVLGEDEADEREILRDLVKRKRARYPDKLKFMQFLARQGFSYDDIKTVLGEESTPD